MNLTLWRRLKWSVSVKYVSVSSFPFSSIVNSVSECDTNLPRPHVLRALSILARFSALTVVSSGCINEAGRGTCCGIGERCGGGCGGHSGFEGGRGGDGEEGGDGGGDGGGEAGGDSRGEAGDGCVFSKFDPAEGGTDWSVMPTVLRTKLPQFPAGVEGSRDGKEGGKRGGREEGGDGGGEGGGDRGGKAVPN